MRVNQKGEPVEETVLQWQGWGSGFGDYPTKEETREVLGMLLEHLQLEAVRTNATKHGNVEIIIRSTK